MPILHAAYLASDEALDAAKHAPPGRWKELGGREVLRGKVERAVAVELASGRLTLPRDLLSAALIAAALDQPHPSPALQAALSALTA